MSIAYRKNVGVVVFNSNKKVLLCSRIDKKDGAWQFPQGGIDDNEDIEIAAKRELFEETSITSVKTVFITKEGYCYDFPKDIQGKYNYKGQCQYWVLLYFNGQNKEINLNTKEPEFKDYKWDDIKTAPNEIINFKKDVYNKITTLFEPIINEYQV